MSRLTPLDHFGLLHAIPAERRWRVLLGWLSLAALLASILITAPGWPGLVLSAIATVGLAGDERLGWIGAAAVVALGVPFGVSASTFPATVGDLPLDPQLIAIAIGVLGMLPQFHLPPSERGRVLVMAVSVFLLVGMGATVAGLAEHNVVRDVLRDARWWGLYAVSAIIVLTRTRRSKVLRGLVTGVTIFAAMVIVTAVLPVFDSGLKDAVLTYWSGALRLQTSNSALLTPVLICIMWRWNHRPSIRGLAWVTLLATAQVMSLTRVAVVVMALVVATLALTQRSGLTRSPRAQWIARGALAVGLPALAFVLGVSLVGIGTSTAPVGSRYSPSRLTLGDSQIGLGGLLDPSANPGRFSSYGRALLQITHAPLLGSGMGQLVYVAFATRDFQAHTLQWQPGVDDAPLTVGLKAGALGIAAFGAMLLLPLWRAIRMRRFRSWYLLAWLALLAVMLSQSFAVSGYGPFGVGLLMVLPFLDP